MAQWLGWLAAIAFVARLVPQPVKLWRTGLPTGVSMLAVLSGVVTDVGWILYGVTSDHVQIWLVSVVALVPGIWTAVLMWPHRTRAALIGASLWLVLVVATLPLGAIGSVLAVSVVVNHGPQVWKVLRESDLSGIAVGTWGLAIVDATLWGSFGVLEGDRALIGYGVVLLACAIIVLGRVHWTARHRPTTPHPLPADVAEGLAYTPGP